MIDFLLASVATVGGFSILWFLWGEQVTLRRVSRVEAHLSSLEKRIDGSFDALASMAENVDRLTDEQRRVRYDRRTRP